MVLVSLNAKAMNDDEDANPRTDCYIQGLCGRGMRNRADGRK